MDLATIRAVDAEVADAIAAERHRQNDSLQLIASENHASPAVLAAQGTLLTNKYAEGYPGRRYYGGCEAVDRVERAAIDRAKRLWGAEHVNVQPHSGTQANQAVYAAMLDPGDRILSLSLEHGGHLSHGHPANFAGQLYDVEHYELDEASGRLNYDAIRARVEAVQPDLVVSGYSAYPRTIDWGAIQAAAETVGAIHLADMAHITGLVAAGLHPSPVGIADFVTGSTHKTIRSGRGGLVLCEEAHAEAIDAAVFPGVQGGPIMHDIAGKAVGFKEALEPEFETYAEAVVENAQVLGEALSGGGLELVTGGTDTHLVLVDLRPSHPSLTGKAAEAALEDVGLVLNKNTVPGETRSPFVASGIRIGTPAVTTRGMGPDEMREVASCILEVLDAPSDEATRDRTRERVRAIAEAHPAYPEASG
ncbi:MAG: serine hydroxymethyltransferase [Halobacteriales archaeon]